MLFGIAYKADLLSATNFTLPLELHTRRFLLAQYQKEKALQPIAASKIRSALIKALKLK